jgi:hypothetical protein
MGFAGRGDNAPVRFLSYFIAALQAAMQTIEAGIGEAALTVVHALEPQPSPAEDVLTSLINDIATISDPFGFILDDDHLVEAQPIHQALTFLLAHLPPQMHLVIVSPDLCRDLDLADAPRAPLAARHVPRAPRRTGRRGRLTAVAFPSLCAAGSGGTQTNTCQRKKARKPSG